ncbi:MAG TPA: hypothetical protein ENI62_04330 [Gammaproteobacteria bacterium]|nr:hypothetical protein [Gammaproteobacteria bacterium]
MKSSHIYATACMSLLFFAGTATATPPLVQINPDILKNLRSGQPALQMQVPTVSLKQGIYGTVSINNSSSRLFGYGIKVRLRQGGRLLASQSLTLNSLSRVNYHFRVGPGSYVVTVVKGPRPRSNPRPRANWCFSGTSPGSRTATLSTTHPAATGQNFTINYAVAWNLSSSCW